MEYRLSKLKDITTYIARGITPKYTEDLTGLCVINQKCIRDYKLLLENARKHDISKKQITDEKVVQKYDILINSTGVGTAGRVAQNFENQIITADSHVTIVRPDSNKINPIYLGYAVKNQQKYIEGLAEGSTGQTEISRQRIGEEILIKFPTDKQVQKMISGFLLNIDEKIKLNNQINDNLQELLKQIFNEMFFNKIQLNDVNGFKEQTLYDVLDVIDNRGKTPELVEFSEYPIIDVKAISGENRIIDYKQCQKYVSKEVYNTFFRSGHPRINDVLISTVGSLAEMKVYKENKGTIAQNVVALRSKTKYPMYIYQYLKAIKNDLISYNIGSVQPSIKVTQFMKHNIFFPKEEELAKFEKIAQVNTDKMFNIAKENEQLEQLRDILLPKLMNGEIDLDKIEI